MGWDFKMKKLIKKILKESEDDWGWVSDVTSPIPLDRKNFNVTINICNLTHTPEDFKDKLLELFPELKPFGVDTPKSIINWFDNERIMGAIERGEGYLLNVNSKWNGWEPKNNIGIYGGWTRCEDGFDIFGSTMVVSPQEFFVLYWDNDEN